MNEVCVWSIEEGSFSYDTGCGDSYNPYVNCPDVYPPIINDKCPFCGKEIEYREDGDDEEEEEEDEEEIMHMLHTTIDEANKQLELADDDAIQLVQEQFYHFAGYDWIVTDKTSKYAILQSYGVTSGPWPGYKLSQFGNNAHYTQSIDGQDISSYDEKTKELYDLIKGVEFVNANYGRGLYLLSGEYLRLMHSVEGITENSLGTLMAAAATFDPHGLDHQAAWLGDPCDSEFAWAAEEIEGIQGNFSQNCNLVVAPAFNLDIRKVKLDDINITLKDVQSNPSKINFF